MSHPSVIHATPPLAPLPASDIDSIYLVSVAQSQCPGRWSSTTGGWGDNRGDSPYITHLDRPVAPSHLPHPDADLSPADRAEALAWVAYIDAKVSDLVNHSSYSLPRNHAEKVAPAQAAASSFPRSVYVPQRLRAMYKTRLQAVGLWGLGGISEADLADEDRKRLEQVYVQAPGGTVAPRAWSGWRAGKEYEDRRRKRGEEELERVVKETFGVLDRRLGSKPYFFSNRPTSADLRLFAHLSLVLDTDLPNPLLAESSRTHYPNLVSHQDRSKWSSFGPDSWSIVPIAPPRSPNTPSWDLSGWFKSTGQVNKADAKFKRARWMWYTGAFAAMVTYVFASGLVQIEFSEEDEDEEEDE